MLSAAACDSELPIEPVEEYTGDSWVVFYQDSIGVLKQVIDFEPTFIGRQSVVEIPVAYLDTFTLELAVSCDDSVFQVSPAAFTFTKSKKTTTLKVTFKPELPDSQAVAHLHFQVSSYLLSPDTTMEVVAEDSLRLEGLGQNYYLDLEMVFIPGGPFTMGSGTAEDTADVHYENPDELYSHQVVLSDFFIGRYEVTNQQYYEFWVEQGDSTNRPDYSTVFGAWPQDALEKPNHPVVGVSWEDAVAFCRWLSLRTSQRYTLPTEAQWEYVAVGAEEGRKYPWLTEEPQVAADTLDGGQEEPVYRVNIQGVIDGYQYTAPVDRFPAGVSKFGTFNMAGNVWEWCLDWYDPEYYRYTTETDDPKGPPDPAEWLYKVVRGGSWLESLKEARCANRGALDPRNREYNVGFRVVRLP